MTGRSIIVLLAVATGLYGLATAWAKEAPGGLRLEERTVPVPAGASSELRKILGSRAMPPQVPVPQDLAGWKQIQDAVDAKNAKDAHELAKSLGGSWKPMEVGGVPCFLVTPNTVDKRYANGGSFHLHGGAFVLNGGEGCVREALWVADACKARVLSVDYRRRRNTRSLRPSTTPSLSGKRSRRSRLLSARPCSGAQVAATSPSQRPSG